MEELTPPGQRLVEIPRPPRSSPSARGLSAVRRRKLRHMRLGRPKDRQDGKAQRGKHRPAPPAEPVEEPDHELESYLAALSPTPNDPESTDSGKRFGNALVYQVRMPAEADERLRNLAIERGTSPLALLQDWVLQRLEWELRGRKR